LVILQIRFMSEITEHHLHEEKAYVQIIQIMHTGPVQLRHSVEILASIFFSLPSSPLDLFLIKQVLCACFYKPKGLKYNSMLAMLDLITYSYM